MTSCDNPFPGIDPWMEADWSDVRGSMTVSISDVISESLPLDLRALIQQPAVSETWKHGVPPQWTPELAPGGVRTAEPKIVHVDAETPRWIEIRDRSGRLVTVIELLSPTNKGWDQENYHARQRTYLNSHVNLVEIDLLRGGRHSVALPPDQVRPPGDSARGIICVVRDAKPSAREVYYLPLRERLRAIRIPLRPTDADVVLDLQPLIDRCYRTGGYWQTDYSLPPEPPLNDADTAWAKELLQQAKRL